MGRSIKKGPFVDPKLAKKVEAAGGAKRTPSHLNGAWTFASEHMPVRNPGSECHHSSTLSGPSSIVGPIVHCRMIVVRHPYASQAVFDTVIPV